MSPVSRLTPRVLRFTYPLLLGGILIVYLTLSLYQINLPGLHYDEAFEAVPALQLLQNQPVTTFRHNGLTFGSQTFPLMTQDYIGALNTYMVLPFIAILGATPVALRVMSIVVGSITLWLAYALSNQLTGNRRVGLVAALLLSVDPTFIFWNRQGIFVTAVTAAIGLSATFCWWRRFQSGSTGWAMAGAFLFGLGLYAKLLFVWLIVALIGSVVLLNLSWTIHSFGDLFRGTLKLSSRKEAALATLAFLLGCWPLILYNIQTGGTLSSVTQNAQTSYYGVNNLAFGPNLTERFRQFLAVLNGSHLWYLGDVWHTPLPSFVFGVFFVLVISTTMRKIVLISPPLNLLPIKIAFFPFLVIGLVILVSIGTVSALWITHFALLMPWPAMAIAIGSWFMLTQAPQPKARKRNHPGNTYHVSRITYHASRFTLWIGLCLLIGAHLFNTIRYHTALAESGGLSSHSDAIYDLSDWLTHQASGSVVAMDWGLAAPVTYLTGGQITPVEVFGYTWESDTQLTARLQKLIAQPDTLYLWRAPDEIIFDRSQEFKALYRPLNLEENIEDAFYERSGRPILGVTRLVAKGTAENPP
jgi:4-amino-4-deoxy-L-arabinose transferase-like glycosyltransferase